VLFDLESILDLSLSVVARCSYIDFVNTEKYHTKYLKILLPKSPFNSYFLNGSVCLRLDSNSLQWSKLTLHDCFLNSAKYLFELKASIFKVEFNYYSLLRAL